MYLKEIAISGFKSFADRTRLDLRKGVTAVVGPNGCGKSNIVDAIRWVLGEQSAKALRGASMQDVIFEGTDKRKALPACEVTLTFTDCEVELGTQFNEVAITRRVTRDAAAITSSTAKLLASKTFNDSLPIQGWDVFLILSCCKVRLTRFYRLTQPSDAPSSKKLPESLYARLSASPQQAGASRCQSRSCDRRDRGSFPSDRLA